MSWAGQSRDPRRAPGSSLALTTGGRVALVIGGSRFGGGGTSFGSAPLPVVAFPTAGEALIYRDGVQASVFRSEYGAEYGMVDVIRRAGKLSNVRIASWIVEGTAIGAWITDHFAAAVASMASLGLTPNIVAYAISGTDDASAGLTAALSSNLLLLQRLVDQTWPGAGFVVFGSTDTANSGVAACRATAIEHCAAPTGRRRYVDPVGVAIQGGGDDHPSAAGSLEQGIRVGQAWLTSPAFG